MKAWAVGITAAMMALPALADDNKGTFSFSLENDYFAGHDDGYTNGARFAWLSPEGAVPGWVEDTLGQLPFFAANGQRRYSLAFGQSMYAPEDLTRKDLIVNDRPYAGWLYGSVGLVADTGRRLDNLQLSLGVVGPSALAAQTQDAVHHIVETRDPQGWDNQLRDEPGVVLTYERKWRRMMELRFWDLDEAGLAVDVTPSLGASLGNVQTYAAAGATVRLGFDLPADYGPPRIRPSLPGSDFFVPTQTLGGYLFAGVEGRAVARDIFLDGNTFRDSHSVEKKHYVGDIQFGLALTYGETRVAYTHIFRSKEFDRQARADEFGAVTVSYRF